MISLAAPSLEQLSKGDPDLAVEYAKIGNDGMAELCQKYPDEFAGFVAQTPLTAKDAGVAETTRAINELGACGTQIFTNVNGKPLDRPEFRPFFAAMEKLDKPIWVHPLARRRTSRIISTRRNRCTKSGGPSAGPTRPRR